MTQWLHKSVENDNSMGLLYNLLEAMNTRQLSKTNLKEKDTTFIDIYLFMQA